MSRLAAVRPTFSSVVLVAVSLGAAAGLLVPSFGSAKGPKDKAARTVDYLVTYDPPGTAPAVSSVHVGKIGKLVRVNIAGNGKADVLAKLDVLDSGGARLTVERATGKHAPQGALPLAITATATIPQSGARKASVGYDALGSSAPATFQGDFEFQGGTTSIALATASPGATLDVAASLVTPDAPGVDPNDLRVGFSPVPPSASLSVGADAASADLSLAAASAATVDVRAQRGAVALDVAVADAPGSVALRISDEGTEGKSLTYRAAAPVPKLDATLRETAGAAVVQETLVTVEGAPTAMDVVQAAPGSVELTADGVVASAEVAFARGGAAQTLDPAAAPAYVRHFADGSASSTAMRLVGVRRASAALGAGVSFEAAAQAGPLVLLLEDGARRIEGRIQDIPSQIALDYSPSAGTLVSAAAAAIAEIRFVASDPAGLLGRATEVALQVQDVPAALTLDVTQSGPDVAVDAHGQEVGRVELIASNASGPSPTIPASRDGLQLRDQGSPYLFFARITGLRSATVSIAPDPELFVDATGNRPFEADLNAQDGAENVHLRATVDRLAPSTRLELRALDERTRLLYSAAAPAIHLAFSTNGSRASDFVEVSLASVPTSLDLCWSNGNECASSSGAANAGAVRVAASRPVTLDLFECARPLTGCTAGNASSSTRLANLVVRTLALDTNVGRAGTSGRMFLDTDNHEAKGSIVRRLPNPSVDRLTAQLPSGFRAQNRAVQWGISSSFPFLPFVNRSGTITCPSGTDLDARLVSLLTVDLDFFAC